MTVSQGFVLIIYAIQHVLEMVLTLMDVSVPQPQNAHQATVQPVTHVSLTALLLNHQVHHTTKDAIVNQLLTVNQATAQHRISVNQDVMLINLQDLLIMFYATANKEVTVHQAHAKTACVNQVALEFQT